eukprot:GHVU01006888.1.p2 GENE.GHVU01006888.1~~GHVU01006888.1.p2  ORF type:complete len:174 (+),score=14.52 GHVU01006888.1:887-1408(+)
MAKKDITRHKKKLLGSVMEGIQELTSKGPKNKPVVTESDLIENLRRLKVTPGEAFRRINDTIISKGEGNIRFNWKMIRFTLFVWERLEEERRGYLKPKIDTVKTVCADVRFKSHYYGYYPDVKFDYDREVKLLNKLIAEKSQKVFFEEGYYYFHKTKKLVPQPLLDKILSVKK